MKSIRLLLMISFLEGSALMAAELIGAKLMAPFYGSSLVVWTSVFICTLSGLAFGYFLGGKISEKSGLQEKLVKVLLFSVVYFTVMSPLSTFIMNYTLSLHIQWGSFLSVLVFLFPLLTSFGMVSPIIIRLLTEDVVDAGKNAGNVYTISTTGGILTTLFVGFYAIPIMGLKVSIFLSSVILALATLIAFLYTKRK